MDGRMDARLPFHQWRYNAARRHPNKQTPQRHKPKGEAVKANTNTDKYSLLITRKQTQNLQGKTYVSGDIAGGGWRNGAPVYKSALFLWK